MSEASSLRLSIARQHGRLSGRLRPNDTVLVRCDACHWRGRLAGCVWLRNGDEVRWLCPNVDCRDVLWIWRWKT